MNKIKYLFIIITLLFLTGCQQKSLPINNSVTNDYAVQELKINNTKLTVEVVKSFQAQIKGLSGRENLCNNCGMLFEFSDYQMRNFWMKEMEFPLDIIWLKDNKIIGIAENVSILDEQGEISSVDSPVAVNKVLEVNAGWLKDNKIGVGDEVEFFNID